MSLAAALMLCSCDGRKAVPVVTMMVTQGFSENIVRTLAEDVKRDLGIEIEFVYENSANQSTMLLQDFANNDLKADIYFTYAKIPNEDLKGSCLDFVEYSNLVSNYPYDRLMDFYTEDGFAYELPLSSRLVGITYNATLMEEKGWELPRNYADMLELKRKCERDGILFAVTDLKFAGHPFNYLFNIVGSQWLSTVKGGVWMEGFLEGTTTMRSFKEAAEYFRRWTEDGMFGQPVDAGTPAMEEFSRRRALFCFANRNTSDGYSGPEYDEYGHPTGRMLNDVHKSMPWISENGSNNCFTVYNNCWMMVNGKLALETNKERLKNVLDVLEYMMEGRYGQMAAEESTDIYMVFNKSYCTPDRIYYDYADQINRGYVQPWYYNEFSDPTVIATGAEVGSYIINCYRSRGWDLGRLVLANYEFNPDASFDSAVAMLRTSLHSLKDDYLGWADEDIEAPKVAELAALSGGLALQELSGGLRVSAGLMPYVEDLKSLQPWKQVAVEDVRLVGGALQKAYSYIIEPPHCTHVVGVLMTGRQIREIVSGKFDPSGYFIDEATGECSFDSSRYGPYPYACVVREGTVLEDDREYLVAVPAMSLEKDVYESFLREGKVLSDGKGIIQANLSTGVLLYFRDHPLISNSSIIWNF